MISRTFIGGFWLVDSQMCVPAIGMIIGGTVRIKVWRERAHSRIDQFFASFAFRLVVARGVR